MCLNINTLNTIKQLIEKVEDVKKAENIRLRSIGPFITGDVTIKVDGKTTINELENITTKIQELLRSQIPNLLRLMVQAEPFKEKKTKTKNKA